VRERGGEESGGAHASGKTCFANLASLAIITTKFHIITDNLNYL
jgi:hypothetical protein